MQYFSFRPLLIFMLVLFALSCVTSKQTIQTTANISRLNFLGVYEIPFNQQYNNTTVGGLSGIDYDAKQNLYYFISDDRSDKNPARFYSARILLTKNGIDSIIITGVKSLLQSDGTAYPNNKQNRYSTPDPEAMRYNPLRKQFIWSSEGERIVSVKDTLLVNPSINFIDPNGKFMDSLLIPANLVMQATENGPRKNGVLEGMSFADYYKILFLSVEEPLYEDGPRADITDNNAFIRIFKYNVAEKKNIAQYAYKLSPVAYPAIPEGSFKINGVPDVLSIGNNKLLVIERSFSSGRIPNTIKLFIADLNDATDVSKITLKNNLDFIPAAKKLLLNMDDLGIYTDNIEGVTFGPRLPNGNKTLLFIADNNFNPIEKTQVLLFEVIE